MPQLKCNCFKKPPSPEDTPVRLRDLEAEGRRFTISTAFSTDASTNSEAPPRPFHDIFYSTDTSFNPITPHSAQFNIRRRESLQAIHKAARKLKDRVSRGSIEEIDPNDPAEGNAFSNFSSDLTDTRSIVQDQDAVPIKTPDASTRRREVKSGSIQMSPHELKRILDRSSTPSPQPTKPAPVNDRPNQFLAPPSPVYVKRRVLSKMLTDRMSQLEDHMESRRKEPSEADMHETSKDRLMKYVFADELSPNPASHRRQATTASLNQQTADLKPRQFSPMSNCVAGRQGSRDVSAPSKKDDQASTLAPTNEQDEPPISAFKPARQYWMRGASGAFDDSRRTSVVSSHRGNTNPADEEDKFEGVDGSRSGRNTRSRSDSSAYAGSTHLYNMQISHRLASSEQLMASKSLPHLRDRSSSNLSYGTGPEFLSILPTRRASSSGFSSSKVPIAWGSPNRNTASSVYNSQESQYVTGPMSKHSSSHSGEGKRLSLYGTSTSNSIQPSRSNSMPQTMQKAQRTGHMIGSEHALLIPKTRNRDDSSADWTSAVTKSERSKSLTVGEIERAEGDVFVRRARTVATPRYFSQADIDELSAEVAKRTPPRQRKISGYDGGSEDPSVRHSLLVPGPSRAASLGGASRSAGYPSRHLSLNELGPSRKPSVIAGIDPIGSSVWDNALREHVREDARIRRRKPGSVSTDTALRLSLDRSQEASSGPSSLRLSLDRPSEYSQEPPPKPATPRASLNRPPESSLEPSSKPFTLQVPSGKLREHSLRPISLRLPLGRSQEGFTQPVPLRLSLDRSSDSSSGPMRSFSETQGGDLQAQLKAYRIQQKSKLRGQMPKIQSHYRVSSSGSSSSWTRYPSHTRRQRTESPATEADNVESRDFTVDPLPSTLTTARSLPNVNEKGSPKGPKKSSPAQRFKRGIKKASSSHFPKLKRSLTNTLRVKSNELAAKMAVDDARGHRSSVSVGAGGSMTEYPELEMLSPAILSPTLEAMDSYFPSFDGTYQKVENIASPNSAKACKKKSRNEGGSKPAMDQSAGGKGVKKTEQGDEVSTKKPHKKAKAKRAAKGSKVRERVQALEASSPPTAMPDVRIDTHSTTSPPLSMAQTSLSRSSSVMSARVNKGARHWSKMYESCVQLPRLTSSPDSGAVYYGNAVGEHFSPLDMDIPRAREGWNGAYDINGAGSPVQKVKSKDKGDYDVRASTLDFRRDLDEEAKREKERFASFITGDGARGGCGDGGEELREGENAREDLSMRVADGDVE